MDQSRALPRLRGWLRTVQTWGTVRWLLVIATGYAVLGAAVGAAGAVLLFTDVGIPNERYTAAPDPCTLISPETIADVVGDVAGERDDPDRDPARDTWISRPAESLKCSWQVNSDDPFQEGFVDVSVQVYYGAQFGLAASGAEKAGHFFTAYHCDPAEERVYESRDGAHVCASGGDPILAIDILDENLEAHILVHPGRSPAWDEPRPWDEGWYPWEQPYPWDPGAEAEQLADEVLANLDAHAS